MNSWGDRFDRKPALTVLLILALAGLFVAAVWGLGVGLSWWKGQGDAVMQNNSAQNWVSAQRAFHQEANDVTSFQAKIATAEVDIAQFEQAHPNLGNGTPYDPLAQQDQNLHTTLTGLTQQCQNTVADYNTNAGSYLTQDWRDAALPDHLDPAMCG